MDLIRLENEIKKRLPFPYKWGGKQSNEKDIATNFIYTTYSFRKLESACNTMSEELKNYAYNRWFNFWSAMAVEYLFSKNELVKANKNKRDKLVDFSIKGIKFDHKTTVFPKGFNKSYTYAKENKKELIQWLYDNQSQEGRKHLENRLFVVLYDSNNKEHWKLKAEIGLLGEVVNEYLKSFNENQLEVFDFGKRKVLSDVIWLSVK